MGKVGLVWRHVKPYFLGFLVVLVVAAAIWTLIYVPKKEVTNLYWLSPKVRFDMENEARRTIAYIIGGVLAVIAISLTFWRNWIAREGQITERFTRAIEQLGSGKMEIRLGAIYALERIAYDSKKDYWPIIETLTAYLRENAPWRESFPGSPVEATRTEGEIEEITTPMASATSDQVVPKLATDIQAILTVLGRRKYRYGQKEEKGRLDLQSIDLRGADFAEAHLEGAILCKVHLEGVNFWKAYLEKAHLEEAYLEGAHFEVANLKGAHLSGAYLQGAFFDGARLDRAELGFAHLEGALFSLAHLEGAFLWGTTGFTYEQLYTAYVDDKTKLPDYMERNKEAKRPEEDSK